MKDTAGLVIIKIRLKRNEKTRIIGPRMEIARCIHKKKKAEPSVAVGWLEDRLFVSGAVS